MAAQKTNRANLARWQHNRFGMFIHWGLYALPARHEWVRNYESISTEKYQPYFDHFNPDLYDPTQWARDCRNAGMKYVVLTTKHHEGFCLWDTKHTDYKCTNTPYGRDLLKPFVKAFRNEGIRVGLYYSIIDWHHPHYTLDHIHPMRNDADAQKADKKKDLTIYADYMRKQARELMTQFGEIDMVFFDFSIRSPVTKKMEKGRHEWESEKLIKLVRGLQPGILINDRLDMEDVPGGWDFKTPEQCMLRESLKDAKGNPIPWETCQTFSGSWGYHRDESSWKSVEQLLKLLIDSVSKSGNLLLNVGPTARGLFDARARERLRGMGDWLAVHGPSIYGCGEAPREFKAPQDCRLTYNAATRRMYVHLFSWPPTGELYLDGFGDKVRYAQLMNDASELKFGALANWQSHWVQADANTLSIKLPVAKPCEVPVVELFLK